MNRHQTLAAAPFRPQHGIALVVALVFLLCLTLIGIAALSTNSTDEKMNYAVADYTRAFQASDSGVGIGETWITQQTIHPYACASSCSAINLVWAATNAATSPVTVANLLTSSWWTTNGLSSTKNYLQDGSTPTNKSSSLALSRLSAQPSYVIEEIGSANDGSLLRGQDAPTYNRYFFRVTGRGTGSQAQTTALTQSVYIHGF